MPRKQPKYKIAGVGELREILEAQKYRCALTGAMLTPQITSFDHLVPLSRGGNSLAGNLQAVTKTANISKSNLTTAEFLRLCHDVLNCAGRAHGYHAVKRRK